MIRKLLNCERGNSLIEMAFAAPILTTLIIGTVDLSMAYSAELEIEQVAQRSIERIQRESYRTSQKSALEAEARAAAGTGSTALITAWLECNGGGTRLNIDSGTCSAGEPYARYVEIQVTRPFSPMFGRYFPGANPNGTVTLDGTAGVRVQ